MKSIQGGIVRLLVALVVMTAGCDRLHHPEALYREAPRPPLEKGREYEQEHQYARAETQYLQIDNLIVKEMTLNQLASAWNSVNANIIRAQESVNQQPNVAKARLKLAQEYYNKGLLCSQYTQGTVGVYPRDFIFGEQEHYYTESLRQAQRAIRLEPNLPEAHLLIAEIYLANGMREEALKELKHLIARHTEYAKGYYAIGKVYLDMKQYNKVERYFIRTIKLNPDFIDAYYLLGKFYFERGWSEYAVRTFLEILRRNPSDSPSFDLLVDSCHQLGNSYVEQGQYDQAILLFQEVLKVRSSYEIHQSLLSAKKKKQEAALMEKETALRPTAPSVETGTEPSPPNKVEPPVIVPEPEEAIPPPELSEPEPVSPFPEQTGQDLTEDMAEIDAEIQLRKTPATLSNQDIVQMIQERGFHHPNNLSNWGLSGSVRGNFQHNYKPQSTNDTTIVRDYVTGLMWEKAGSPVKMNWNEAKTYIDQLNQKAYAGYSDWRLPTVEELASLLEFDKKNGNNFIDPAFDATQNFCWSSDTVVTSNAAWAVGFNSGHIYYDALDRTNYVRAVR